MKFKKSSMPMIFAAILCILLGMGLIVLCIFLPSGDEPLNDENGSSAVKANNEFENRENDPINETFEPEASGSPISDSPEISDSVTGSPEIDDPVSSESDHVSPGESAPEEIPVTPPEPEDTYVSSIDDPLLVLANVDNPLPEDFEVGELEQVQGNYYLDVRAASYAREMISDAKSEGITLQLCSAYRAKDLQQTLFTNKYNYYIQNGWEEDAAYAKTATIIAIPGTSEHQTGLCMDVVTPSYQILDAGYADTDAAKWLYDNAYKYGFILRYPKDKQEITKIIFEPWHYRFVGIENAKLIKDSGLCLEEYLDTLK